MVRIMFVVALAWGFLEVVSGNLAVARFAHPPLRLLPRR